jgi:hypothetical protein
MALEPDPGEIAINPDKFDKLITSLRTVVDNDGVLKKESTSFNDIFPGNEKIAINPDRFDKLITALRTAVDNDGTLDKESTSYNDIFDAFRLALKFYHFQERID